MQIKFNNDKTSISFISDKIAEYSSLHKFPGLLKDGALYYIPAKHHIAFNVINRIRSQFKNVSIEASVMDFINSEFKLKEIPVDFKFFTKPLPFQDIALRYLYTVGSGGLLLDPGMGKSKVVLDYIALMKFGKSLIVCPKPLIFVWEDEVETHRPDLKVHVIGDLEPERVITEIEVDGKTKKKYSYVMDRGKAWAKELEKMKAANADVVVINYNKAVTFKDELRGLNFDFIHVDEFLIKEHSTERTKSLTTLSKSIPYRCGGSGTLINNSVLDMFSPVRYLEPSLVGNNFNNFQDRYAVRKGPKDSHIKFTVGFRNIPEARSILESCCIVMTKAEWLKLPPKTFHRKYIPISEEQRKAYDELSRNYITSIDGSTLEIDNALVMLSKLYQISNGFLYITKEAEGLGDILPLLELDKPKKKASKANRETKFFPKQPKIQALNSLLDYELKCKKAIIWFNMEAEYILIKDLLERRGDSFLTIKGGESGTGNKVRQFNKTPSIRWLVCQAKSVNYGITVLGTSLEKLEASDIEALPNVSSEVSDEVFYSLNYSLEVFLQQQDRIHRIGQNNECNYWLLIANTSVEHSIKEAIENKMTIREDMLIDIARKLQNIDSKN